MDLLSITLWPLCYSAFGSRFFAMHAFILCQRRIVVATFLLLLHTIFYSIFLYISHQFPLNSHATTSICFCTLSVNECMRYGLSSKFRNFSIYLVCLCVVIELSKVCWLVGWSNASCLISLVICDYLISVFKIQWILKRLRHPFEAKCTAHTCAHAENSSSSWTVIIFMIRNKCGSQQHNKCVHRIKKQQQRTMEFT